MRRSRLLRARGCSMADFAGCGVMGVETNESNT